MSADTATPPDALAAAVAEAEAQVESGPGPKHTKLAWYANAPWVGSGYGTQSALFVPLISQLGYDCAYLAFHGLRGSRLAWRSPMTGEIFPVYPGGQDLHANDVLGAHVKHWFGQEGGLVIALTDPWVINPKIARRLPLLAWTPLDHSPMIPGTRNWLHESHALPVAMSKFGKEQMHDEGFETVYYVPHGFNPHTFKPADRTAVRRALRIPDDRFVVGMVAANLGSRKSFSQAIDAFGRFRATHPDALLYLHTKLENPKGEDIPAICAANKVKPMVSDQYGMELGMPDSIVAATMSAFDVLLNPAMGEGFGLAPLEAQACGTPCITTNFSAMPEVAPVDAGNWAVGGQRVWTGFGSYQVIPSVDEIVAALEEAHAEDAAAREARRVSVWRHVMNEYQADYVTETYWKPVLADAALQIAWRDQQMERH